ncbi:MAG: sigma-54 dependent transcriptional regulator [Thiomicrorhabdus sp.]|nr:sigma-54 dependent transcriptional regulator [Thiomicrorhabdus sp.]
MDAQKILEILEQSSLAGTKQEYLSLFSDTLSQKVGLSGSACFKLNLMKDQLLSVSSTSFLASEQALSFSLTDTQNPIVYSLISNKPYVVQVPNTLPNIGVDLLHLIKTVPSNHAMLCLPFKQGLKKRNHNVFVFFADLPVIKQMQADKSYQRLFSIMESVLGIYALAEAKDKEKQVIKNDLAQQSKSNTQKTVKEQIIRQYIGKSASVKLVCDLVARAASSKVSVLLRGETGVGKDFAASLIHQYSSCSKGRFIVVNCAAIPEHLLESELFGYSKGAFTGANQNKKGLIKQADGGTLFLDEIGDLSEALQAKLLRVLQEKRFIPVGANQEEFSDFRLITATHRPLEQWIKEGLFRQDLFYRINQFNITIPALTERKDDIPALVELFTNTYMQENAMHISGYEDSAISLLKGYHYPGNIRELKNIVFQSCMFVGTDNLVTQKNIQARLENLMDSSPEKTESACSFSHLDSGFTLPEATGNFEQKLIKQALKKAKGSRSEAADTLGIPKRTLAHKCKKWSIYYER